MAAGRQDLLIEQGAEFRLQLHVAAFDMTGYTAAMQVRDKIGGNVIFDLSTDGGLTITPGVDSIVEIHITDDQTGAWTGKKAVYDLKLTPPNGEDMFLIRGSVFNVLEVTESGS